MTRDLSELSGPAAAATLTQDSIVVLPIGAVEHHGPHLPLATDFIMADMIGRSIVDGAAARGIDAWRLPGLAFAKSDEHDWAPGTIWLSWDTFMRTIVDIGRSVAGTPARTLVFYNGHGGNIALLQVALRELRRLFGLRTFLMSVAIPAGDGVNGPDEMGFGIHGGHGETSMILHLRPELVDLSQAERWVPDHLAGFDQIAFNGGSVSFGWLSNDFGPSGVIGDATGASSDFGAELFAHAVERGVEALAEIAKFRHLP